MNRIICPIIELIHSAVLSTMNCSFGLFRTGNGLILEISLCEMANANLFN